MKGIYIIHLTSEYMAKASIELTKSAIQSGLIKTSDTPKANAEAVLEFYFTLINGFNPNYSKKS